MSNTYHELKNAYLELKNSSGGGILSEEGEKAFHNIDFKEGLTPEELDEVNTRALFAREGNFESFIPETIITREFVTPSPNPDGSGEKPTVIIGAGPIGLYTAIRLRQGGKNIVLIEARKEYERQQIFFIQRSLDFQSFFNLPEEVVLEVMRQACLIVPPIFGRQNECYQIDPRRKDYETFKTLAKGEYHRERGDLSRGIFLGIKISDFEDVMRRKFLELRGRIVKPTYDNTGGIEETKGTARLDGNGDILLRYELTDGEQALPPVDYRIEASAFERIIDASGGRFISYDKHYVTENDYNSLTLNLYQSQPGFIPPREDQKLSYGLLLFIDKNDTDDFTRFRTAKVRRLPRVNDDQFVSKMIPGDEAHLHHIAQHRYRAFVGQHSFYVAIMISKQEYSLLQVESKGKIGQRGKKGLTDYVHRGSTYLNYLVNSALFYYGMVNSRNSTTIFGRTEFDIIPVSLSRITREWIISQHDQSGKLVYPIGDSALGVNFFSGTGVNYGFEMSDMLINHLLNNTDPRIYEGEFHDFLTRSLRSSVNFMPNFNHMSVTTFFNQNLGITADSINLPEESRPYKADLIYDNRIRHFGGNLYFNNITQTMDHSDLLALLLRNGLSTLPLIEVYGLDDPNTVGNNYQNDRALLIELLNKLYFYVINTFSKVREQGNDRLGSVKDMDDVHVRYMYWALNNKVHRSRPNRGQRKDIPNLLEGKIYVNQPDKLKEYIRELPNSQLFMLLLTTFVSYIETEYAYDVIGPGW